MPIALMATAGSSPHTRGALEVHARAGHRLRIIPAYAGSTGYACNRYVDMADHPRIRGEHERLQLGRELGKGSSPHTRGARTESHLLTERSGIIPAYAGSTTNSKPWTRLRWDHPRIRGEHEANSLDGQTMAGSSPHTRGAHHDAAVLQGGEGIIPAYAGSTT